MDRLEHSTIRFPILISTLISSIPQSSFNPLSSRQSPRVEGAHTAAMWDSSGPSACSALFLSAYELLLILQNPAVMVTISKTDSPGSRPATFQNLKSSTRINRIAKMLITLLLFTRCGNAGYDLVLIKNIHLRLHKLFMTKNSEVNN